MWFNKATANNAKTKKNPVIEFMPNKKKETKMIPAPKNIAHEVRTRYGTLLSMCRCSEKQLKEFMVSDLSDRGRKIFAKQSFLYSPGNHPVMLVAHLDTVHKNPVTEIMVSKDYQLDANEGIGGDDRCGVYIIHRLLDLGFKGSVLLTEGEEIGGIGAMAFATWAYKEGTDIINQHFPNYIVEFDRRGCNDSCYYNNDNKEFETFINEHGFKTAYGSFSDISIIAPKLGVSAVNLSSGYYNAHTVSEYIDLTDVEEIITKANKLVNTESQFYEYIENKMTYRYSYSSSWDRYDDYAIGLNAKAIVSFADITCCNFDYMFDFYTDTLYEPGTIGTTKNGGYYLLPENILKHPDSVDGNEPCRFVGSEIDRITEKEAKFYQSESWVKHNSQKQVTRHSIPRYQCPDCWGVVEEGEDRCMSCGQDMRNHKPLAFYYCECCNKFTKEEHVIWDEGYAFCSKCYDTDSNFIK